jgi:hypothetical protein
MDLEGVGFDKLNVAQNNQLIAPFCMEEIRMAAWDYDNNKSPGPDGVNFGSSNNFGR